MNDAKPTIVEVRIYKNAGEWCYAADDADGFDHSDLIDVEDEAEARDELSRLFPEANITVLD